MTRETGRTTRMTRETGRAGHGARRAARMTRQAYAPIGVGEWIGFT
jgi:hypothetical protein